MPRQWRTPWWQQSWLLAVWVAIGSVLVVLEISTQAWLALASTVLAMIAGVVSWSVLRRQRRERREDPAERRPGE